MNTFYHYLDPNNIPYMLIFFQGGGEGSAPMCESRRRVRCVISMHEYQSVCVEERKLNTPQDIPKQVWLDSGTYISGHDQVN